MRLLLSMIATLVLLLAGLLLAGWLLVATPQGGRWLAATLSEQLAPLTLGGVEGRLLDRLTLFDLQLDLAGGRLAIDRLELHWSPAKLFESELRIHLLEVGTVELTLTDSGESGTEDRPLPALQWPSPPTWLRSWTAAVDTFRLAGLHLQPAAGEPWQARAIAASLVWQDGHLRVSELRGRSGASELSGRFDIGLFAPACQARFELGRGSSVQAERLELDIALDGSRPGSLLHGPIALTVRDAAARHYRLTGTLNLAPRRLELADLLLDRTELPGTANGRLTLSWQGRPHAALRLALHDWTLPLAEGEAVVFAGQIDGDGWVDNHRGRLRLSSQGLPWQSGRLNGDWSGSTTSLLLRQISGDWLGGELAGNVDIDWAGPLAARLEVSAVGLDPSRLDAAWTGRLNLDADLALRQQDGEPRLTFAAAFRDSELRGLPLRGAARGSWQADTLEFERLELAGDGFSLQAVGSTRQRLDLALQVDDLGGLLPEAAGRLAGDGWLAVRDGIWYGALQAQGAKIAYADLSVAQAALDVRREAPAAALQFSLLAEGGGYRDLRFERVTVDLHGDPVEQALQLQVDLADGRLQAGLTNRIDGQDWLLRFDELLVEQQDLGAWQLAAPTEVRIAAETIDIGTLRLRGDAGEIALAALLSRQGRPRQIDVTLRGVDLALLTPWLAPWSLSGRLDATLACGLDDCRVTFAGLRELQRDDWQLALDAFGGEGHWDAAGLTARLELVPARGGRLAARLVSGEPWRWSRPAAGELIVELQELNPAALCGRVAGWTLPDRLRARLTADWVEHRPRHLGLELAGRMQLADLPEQPDDPLTINFAVEGKSDWLDDRLRGALSLRLAEEGSVQADWQLPVAPQWPWQLRPDGPVQLSLTGTFAESGLLGFLLPNLVQETGGALRIAAEVGGTWQAPVPSGSIALREGHAYLPIAGISLEGVQLTAQLEPDRIDLVDLQVTSDGGRLAGAGSIRLRGWRPDSFQLQLDGENFALVHLPELQLRVSPALRLSGTPQRARLTGEIRIPSLLVRGRAVRNPVGVSPDVILVDAPPEPEPTFAIDWETDVRLLLGDQVLVKLFGLDARLGGELRLNGIEGRHLSGHGQIEIVDGAFSTYGVKLGIERGRAVFAGGRLDNPAIDILALRPVGTIKAGVRIGGLARTPEVKLYSEPGMADTDILSYIVLGRPLDQAGGELNLLMMAVGGLLSAGDSAVLRNRLQSRLGIDTLELGSETGQTEDTVLRLGKYLTPDLYVSYGYSLFQRQNQLGLRYRLTENWEAESNLGVDSGADLYYRFQFD
ncbi:MAG: translocation/assembly module TamB domain-containing protein [Desulfuromonadales bacterium]|nr:translocation/assembly module TamB domain-containing protein [Desulfuromonadales bacterium]